MDEIASRIAGLREALDRYNYAYYVLSAPEISDKVFDEMMKELEELEKTILSLPIRIRQPNVWEAIYLKNSIRLRMSIRCCRWATPIRMER